MTRSGPPTIIAFASPKGGAGKSTNCLNIAGALCKRGQVVHIVDFDQSQTLWRWYQDSSSAQAIANLTVAKAPDKDLDLFVRQVWKHPADYVLIDLAGHLSREMLHLAVFATLTITPTKISEPDIVEADKLHAQLEDIQTRISKPIIHRLLINEVPFMLAAFEYALLDQLASAEVPRFHTLMRKRSAYGETFMSGQPPHYADQSRPSVTKAVAEIDALVDEIIAATTTTSAATETTTSAYRAPAEGEGTNTREKEAA